MSQNTNRIISKPFPPVKPDKPYDVAVVMGRFQIAHLGHGTLFSEAEKLSDNIIVLIGSANRSPDFENPFDVVTRQKMLYGFLAKKNTMLFRHIDFVHMDDFWYSDDMWKLEVQRKVGERISYLQGLLRGWEDKPTPAKVCLVGNMKSDTNYLDWFPMWDKKIVETSRPDLSATPLRRIFFGGEMEDLRPFVTPECFQVLEDFKTLDNAEYSRLKEEFLENEKYIESWSQSPYPPMFVTVDSVVIKNGHVLMIERKDSPGKGLFAIPGGFVEQGERLKDAALRELNEETNIDVPPAILRNAQRGPFVFDHPRRSRRGRVITNVYSYKLDGRDTKPGLPKVVAGSDAKSYKWMSFAEIFNSPRKIFEDHLDIIQRVISSPDNT